MRVRRAVPDDADAIAAVHVGTWQVAYENVFGAEALAAIDVGPRRAMWERTIAAGSPVFVAEQDGAVVAFASAGPAREDESLGELYAIYALPAVWGSDAGPALMHDALAALRAAGFGAAILWVLEDNPRARRFYEREGWRLDGGRKEDDILGAHVAEVRYRIEL